VHPVYKQIRHPYITLVFVDFISPLFNLFPKDKPWSIVNGQVKFAIFEKKVMLVGEISNKTGLSRDTIRFYEKKGLIKVNRTDSDWNNYKNYSEKTLSRLLLIKKAKSFGFTLNEIAEILDLFEMNTANCHTMTKKVNEKLKEIDKKIKELKDIKKMIFDKFDDAQNNCVPISENANCPTLSE